MGKFLYLLNFYGQVDGEKSGFGTYLYAYGDKYIGEFKDGEKHGRGVLEYQYGAKYVNKN